MGRCRFLGALTGGLLATAALLSSCSNDAPSAPGSRPELTVYAAASLRDVLRELATSLEESLGAKLILNLGSSGDLARQIVAGGQADVFLSADEQEMDRLAGLALLAGDTRRDFLANRLAVVEPFETTPEWKSGFATPFDVGQLARDEVTQLSLANVDTVPAGRYAKAWLEARGVWPELAGRVLPGIDVRAALASVESGGAQAGIVYRTDALRSARVRVVYEVPRDESPAIVYPLAALRAARDPSLARRLLEFLEGPLARAAFERHGFEVLPLAR